MRPTQEKREPGVCEKLHEVPGKDASKIHELIKEIGKALDRPPSINNNKNTKDLLRQIQQILDQYKQLPPSPENKLNFLPQAIGEGIEEVLQQHNLSLKYNPNLTNFSKKGNQFATFGQLKVLLEEVNFTLHGDDSDEPDWEGVFEQLDLTQDEKAELQARNQARIENFATAVQEESFAPRDLRVLRKATQKAEQTTSQEVEQNAEQKDTFPLLSQALVDKELTPSQYKQLMQYLGKYPEFSQYEEQLQIFSKENKFNDLISFFEAGLANDLIKMMRKKLIGNLIKIMKAGQTENLIEIMEAGQTGNLIKIMEAGQIWNLIEIMRNGQTGELIKIMEAGQTGELIKIMEAGQTGKFIDIMKEGYIQELTKIMKAGQTDEFTKIMKAGRTYYLIQIMKAGQTGKLIDIMKVGQTDELIKIMRNQETGKLIKIMEAGQTGKLIKIMEAGQTGKLIKIMEAGKTDKLIDIMKAGKTDKLIDLLSEFDFQEAKEKYGNDPEFRKELLTTMKTPRRKKSWRKF